MQMDREEIARRYKEAKYKKQQIQILAQLNCCDTETIQEVLRQSGIETKTTAAKTRKTPEKPINTKTEGKQAAKKAVRVPEAVKEAVTAMLEKKKTEIEADRQELEEKTKAVKELEGFLQKC